jgi:hypothetical protein
LRKAILADSSLALTPSTSLWVISLYLRGRRVVLCPQNNRVSSSVRVSELMRHWIYMSEKILMKTKRETWVQTGVMCTALCTLAGIVFGLYPAKARELTGHLFLVFVMVQIFSVFYFPCMLMLLRPPHKVFLALFFISLIGIPVIWIQAGYYVDISGPYQSTVQVKMQQRTEHEKQR